MQNADVARDKKIFFKKFDTPDLTCQSGDGQVGQVGHSFMPHIQTDRHLFHSPILNLYPFIHSLPASKSSPYPFVIFLFQMHVFMNLYPGFTGSTVTDRLQTTSFYK